MADAPNFWQSADLEPKRAFKFVLSIAGGTGVDVNGNAVSIPQFLVKKVNKPSFTVSESEHKFLNHSFWFPGKVSWNEVSFTIVDVLGSSDGSAAVMSLLQAAGYSWPGNINASDTKTLQTISKKKSVEALGDVIIRQLDSGGGANGEPRVMEEWRLFNAWIKDAKFGDLDYDSEDMLNVEIALKYDNAALQSSDNDGKPTAILRGTKEKFSRGP